MEKGSNCRLYFFVSEGQTLLAKMFTKWYQWGNVYTHSGIVLSTDSLLDPLVCAAVDKVRMGRFSDVHKRVPQKKFRYYYVNVFDRPFLSSELISVCYEYLDKGYDGVGLLSFLLRRNVNNSNRYFCSEMVYEILQRFGVSLFREGMVMPYQVNTSKLLESKEVHEDTILNLQLEQAGV